MCFVFGGTVACLNPCEQQREQQQDQPTKQETRRRGQRRCRTTVRRERKHQNNRQEGSYCRQGSAICGKQSAQENRKKDLHPFEPPRPTNEATKRRHERAAHRDLQQDLCPHARRCANVPEGSEQRAKHDLATKGHVPKHGKSDQRQKHRKGGVAPSDRIGPGTGCPAEKHRSSLHHLLLCRIITPMLTMRPVCLVARPLLDQKRSYLPKISASFFGSLRTW